MEFVDHKGQMLTARAAAAVRVRVRCVGRLGGAEARGAAERGGTRVRDDIQPAAHQRWRRSGTGNGVGG